MLARATGTKIVERSKHVPPISATCNARRTVEIHVSPVDERGEPRSRVQFSEPRVFPADVEAGHWPTTGERFSRGRRSFSTRRRTKCTTTNLHLQEEKKKKEKKFAKESSDENSDARGGSLYTPSPYIADVRRKKKKKYPSRLERKRSMRQTVATHEGHDTAADARARARVSPPNSKFARAVRMYSLSFSLSRAIIAMSRANLKACR